MDNPAIWGKPEVFWVAVQAVVAGLGLVALVIYTITATRQTKLTQETRRASIQPTFAVEDQHFESLDLVRQSCVLKLSVRNFGEGIALNVNAWHRPVSAAFALRDTSVFQRNDAESCAENALVLAKNGSVTFTFEDLPLLGPYLFVISGTDQANGTHQLQILRQPKTEDGLTFSMQATLTRRMGSSIGEKVVAGVERFLEVEKRVAEAMEKQDRDRS